MIYVKKCNNLFLGFVPKSSDDRAQLTFYGAVYVGRCFLSRPMLMLDRHFFWRSTCLTCFCRQRSAYIRISLQISSGPYLELALSVRSQLRWLLRDRTSFRWTVVSLVVTAFGIYNSIYQSVFPYIKPLSAFGQVYLYIYLVLVWQRLINIEALCLVVSTWLLQKQKQLWMPITLKPEELQQCLCLATYTGQPKHTVGQTLHWRPVHQRSKPAIGLDSIVQHTPHLFYRY